MSIIEEKCKQKGVRLTDQRKVIAKVMSDSKETYGSKDHPDVDELHKRVSLIDDKTDWDSQSCPFSSLNLVLPPIAFDRLEIIDFSWVLFILMSASFFCLFDLWY